MAGKGLTFLLKLGDGGSPSETFTTIAGARSHSISTSREQVDVTNKGSAGKRQLLEGAGVAAVTIQASGVFEDDAALATIRGYVADGTHANYELVFDNGDKYAGSFEVASLEEAGEHNGEQTYSFTLESAGAWTFTAA